MRHHRMVRFGGLSILAGLAVIPATAGALSPLPCNLTPGKEYSNLLDTNAAGGAAPGQIVLWDGLGGATDDGVLSVTPNDDVDALANIGDAFFFDVLNNTAALLVSVAGDAPGVPIQAENDLGTITTWATKLQVNANGSVNDLDGLEVWGSDGFSDTTHYSLFGDPGGAAIIDRSSGLTVLSTSGLQAILGLGPNTRPDLDALMMAGDEILFSIRELRDPATGAIIFDGGEIWHANIATGVNYGFLNHGGHLWDTAFDVGKATGCLVEDIDALEATQLVVPEPASMAALALGALGVLRRRVKKA